MITVDNYFKEVRECTYKGEVYSVRDNGAVLRHSREGKRVRKHDNVWTFGKVDEKTGYCNIGTERVHRIVAFAFLGAPPTQQYVVDHMDTNRQNNRPENLRWLTKLENALNNPITRARIENICGIDVFVKNPAILHGHEKTDPNFNWMRAVSPDEAKAALENLTKWSKEGPTPKGGTLGEWVYQRQNKSMLNNKWLGAMNEIAMSNEFDSLTPNVVQVKWKTPTEFPLCPQGQYIKPLEEYKNRLTYGAVFSRNEYNETTVVDSTFVDEESILLVLCEGCFFDNEVCYLVKVTYEDNLYYHKSVFTYYEEKEAREDFISIQEDINILEELEEYYQ